MTTQVIERAREISFKSPEPKRGHQNHFHTTTDAIPPPAPEKQKALALEHLQRNEANIRKFMSKDGAHARFSAAEFKVGQAFQGRGISTEAAWGPGDAVGVMFLGIPVAITIGILTLLGLLDPAVLLVTLGIWAVTVIWSFMAINDP